MSDPLPSRLRRQRQPPGRRAGPKVPVLLIVPAVIGAGLFVLPLIGLLGRVPYTRLGTLLTGDVAGEALRLSLISSVAAAGLSALLGVPLAWVLARTDVPGKELVRALVTLPMVLPPVVGGAALLFALGRRGLLGEPLY